MGTPRGLCWPDRHWSGKEVSSCTAPGWLLHAAKLPSSTSSNTNDLTQLPYDPDQPPFPPPIHFFPFRICLSLLFFMLLNIWATDDPVSTLLPLAIILSFFTSQQNFSQVFFRSVNNVVQLGQVRAGPWSLRTQAIKPLRKKGDSNNGSSLTFS